jgi:hypothetical protein
MNCQKAIEGAVDSGRPANSPCDLGCRDHAVHDVLVFGETPSDDMPYLQQTLPKLISMSSLRERV